MIFSVRFLSSCFRSEIPQFSQALMFPSFNLAELLCFQVSLSKFLFRSIDRSHGKLIRISKFLFFRWVYDIIFKIFDFILISFLVTKFLVTSNFSTKCYDLKKLNDSNVQHKFPTKIVGENVWAKIRTEIRTEICT